MLDVYLDTIVWEIINFIIITVALYYLVFKPMARNADRRAKEKAELLRELEEDREEAARKLEEINQRLSHLDEEIEQILQEAYEKSRARQEELLQATYEEAAQIMADAIKQARQEQRAELNKNRQVFTDTILQITGEILQQVIPPQVNDILIDDLTASIWNLGEDDVQRLNTIRGSLEEQMPIIDLTVVRPLTIEQQSKLYNTFSALADKDVEINVEVEPRLIAGVRARIGDFVLDNSVLTNVDNVRTEVNKILEQLSRESHEHAIGER